MQHNLIKPSILKSYAEGKNARKLWNYFFFINAPLID